MRTLMDDEELISQNFRLEGEEVIRRRTGAVVPDNGRHGSGGYTRVCVGTRPNLRRLYYHRIKYFLLHGSLPPVVDHRDRNTRNNSSRNLRAATQVLNGHNKDYPRQWKRGVNKRKNGRFVAQVWEEGKPKYLGSFASESEASLAVEQALKEIYGEHYSEA